MALFRIAQEALANVAKHAQATKVTISKEEEDYLVRLIIADNGVGFDQAQATSTASGEKWGIMTMTERARTVGGKCHIESKPGHGTRVVVEVPRN